jgi:FAD/FMN-containing dehydrogenase
MFDQIAAMPYTTLQSSGDESNAFGRRFYGKAGFLPDMNGHHVDELLAISEQTVAAGVSIVMQQGGGAIGRIPIDASAFANRRARYWVMVAKGWKDVAEDEKYIGGVRRAWHRIEPMTNGFYVNAVMDDEARRIAENYGSNYPRLAQIKRKYDPGNLFRLNANIRPA